jgi:hypothetical protein
VWTCDVFIHFLSYSFCFDAPPLCSMLGWFSAEYLVHHKVHHLVLHSQSTLGTVPVCMQEVEKWGSCGILYLWI